MSIEKAKAYLRQFGAEVRVIEYAVSSATGELAADVGSVIYGEEAVHLGFIDQLGGLREGLDWLYRKMNETRG